MALEDDATVIETVAIFKTADSLQEAIDDLMMSGFDRADLSLLGAEKAVEERLGHSYRTVAELEDDVSVPRTFYVAPEAIGDAEGALIAAPLYVAPLAPRPSFLPMVASWWRPSQVPFWQAGRVPSSACSWRNASAATMPATFGNSWRMAACCYGCGRGMFEA